MTNYGDVTGPRWVGGVSLNAPAPGGDYEALVKWLREFDGPGSNGTNEAADAIEALVEDRDGWRDAARTYKTSRNASDARAEALAAERDALRAQLDGMTIDRPYVAYPGRVRQRLVGPWEDVPDPIDACRTSEGVSDGQQ